MAAKYLIVNPGSASKKYALYEGDTQLITAHFEQEDGQFIVTTTTADSNNKKSVNEAAFKSGINYFLQHLISEKILTDKADVSAIGIRVVSPGSFFTQHQIINDDFKQQLVAQQSSAPLHINPLLAELEQITAIFSPIPVVGVSDSAFHKTIAPPSRQYAIPQTDTARLDLYRFGYHGISVESLLPQIEVLFDQLPSRIIVCHLGGGASLTAVKDGKSIDNSMGYTPLEGLIMATRVGNIDAGALIKLSAANNLSLPELEEYLNTKSGLLGLSEISGDIRELLAVESSNEQAQLALNSYALSVKKYIGAYFALLNGLDLLVFTATVGERSSVMRSRICADLTELGINLDDQLNQKVSFNTVISPTNSPVTIAVLTTDEMQSLAQQTRRLLS